MTLAGFPGTRRYTPIRTLGAGGMGAVYEVKDTTTGAHVALKTMLAPHADALLRFKREFRVLADLHHVNLVRLFDLVVDDGLWFFTMELVKGRTLLRALRPGGVDPDASTTPARRGAGGGPVGAAVVSCEGVVDVDLLRPCTLQILAALRCLHQHGVVHRDIKPGNVLVGDDGVVRVMDFGLAQRKAFDPGISASDVVVGTFDFLAPELLRGDDATAASDLYALGVTLFQILTGRMPFSGGTADFGERLRQGAPRVDDLVADVPRDIAGLVDALLQREPHQRPDVDACCAALGASASSPPASSSSSSSSSDVFVGRVAELATLAAVAERAKRGGRHIAWLKGESGIGKSALAAEAAARAQAGGFRCFASRCYERERVPLLAFDRVVDALVLHLRDGPAARRARLLPSLAALRLVFPVVDLLLEGQAVPAPPADPRERRRAAFHAFCAVVSDVAADGPVLLVLDDLHWADDDSLQLLRALLADAADGPGVFVIASVRSDVAFASFGGAVVDVGALDDDAAARLGAAVAHDVDAALVATAAQQAHGNPLLVRQLLGQLTALAPEERARGTLSISGALRGLLSRLTPDADLLAALAAVAGGDVATAVLAAASGRDAAAVARALSELKTLRLLRAQPGGDEERVDFTHDRLREAAWGALDEARRKELHQRLADALEVHAGGRMRDVEALLRHWAAVGDASKRRTFALQAAERAATQLAWGRAADLLRSVYEGDDDADAAAFERVGALYEWAGRWSDARSAYARALALLEERQQQQPPQEETTTKTALLRLLSRVAETCLADGDTDAADDHLARGFAMIGLPLHRSINGRIATIVALQVSIGARRALRSKTALTPWQLERLRFLQFAIRILLAMNTLAGAECELRTAAHADDGDAHAAVRSLAGGAVVTALRGPARAAQVAAQQALLDRAEQIARKHDDALGIEFVQLQRALLWLVTDLARAVSLCRGVVDGYDRLGQRDTLDGSAARTFFATTLMLKGDADEALAFIDADLARASTNHVHRITCHVLAALLQSRRGDVDGASRSAATIGALLDGKRDNSFVLQHALARQAAKAAAGDFAGVLDDAAAFEPRIRAVGGQFSGLSWSTFSLGVVDAAVELRRRDRLAPAQRTAALARAKWLDKKAPLYLGVGGARALAVFAHLDGDAAAAKKQLQRALTRSTVNTNPHLRWLCLEAARELGASTLEQEQEAKALLAQHRFR